MDKEPFLTVDFFSILASDPEQFSRFRHDQFQPEALRTLAEESVFLTSFKEAVRQSVLECDVDFVRYIVAKSTIQRTLTAKFIECVTPIVKQAVAQSMSDMVVNSLSTPRIESIAKEASNPVEIDGDVIDPNNSKIVTTAAERKFFSMVQDLLPGEPLTAKDTKLLYRTVSKLRLTAGWCAIVATKKDRLYNY